MLARSPRRESVNRNRTKGTIEMIREIEEFTTENTRITTIGMIMKIKPIANI
jgi:hypothetical protein